MIPFPASLLSWAFVFLTLFPLQEFLVCLQTSVSLQFWLQQPSRTAAAEAEKHPCICDLFLPLHIAGGWLSTCVFVASCGFVLYADREAA